MAVIPGNTSRSVSEPRPPQSKVLRALGPLGRLIDRWISGKAPSDPLYVSNRTLSQKIRTWIVVAIPCIVIGGMVALMASGYFDPMEDKGTTIDPQAPTSSAANLELPEIKVPDSEIQVNEVTVHRGPEAYVTGTVKNLTAKKFEKVEIVMNLTDHLGSQIGAIGATVSNLQPQGGAGFRVSIRQQNAYSAVVREIQGR